MQNTKRLYYKIIDLLSKGPKTRKELIDSYVATLGLTKEELADRSTASKLNIERSRIGAVINEMIQKGFVTKADGILTAADQKPVIVRNERCEKEILKMLDGTALTKSEIRKKLVSIFGTDKTLTENDDNKLFAFMGDALRRMVNDGVLILTDKRYSLAQKIAARMDDIETMLTLKDSYLTRLHRKGGEFFEVYFMNLLERFVTLYGKTVISCSATGGSADGGIDGIMETVDCLGFRETVMVQTKNRTDMSNETTVRGFYGAVCARQGSRGIFVTSSDFHPAAEAFLKSIDNCVGVDGDMLFKMAIKTHYGIKKVGTEYVVDEKII